MKFELPELRRLAPFGKSVIELAADMASAHDYPPDELTIKAVDDLIADVVSLKELAEDLALIRSTINKMTASLEQKGGSYLRALKRTDYVSPVGKIAITGEWKFRMPKDDEGKALLFEHLRERELFDRYATVNSKSLQSLCRADWQAAIKKDPEAWVLFEVPGVPQPVYDEFTKIKGTNARKVKDDDSDEE